jgi:hypothetical protein
MRSACRTNLTKKTARSLHSARSLPSPPNDCSCAAYAWKRCPLTQSLALIVVDIPSAANACADMSPRASMNVDFLYYAPAVLRIKAGERRLSAVRVAGVWSSHPLSSHIMLSLEVSQTLALDLGLTNEQYSIWTEMEMTPFSIPLYCRKYAHSVHPPRSSANVEIDASGRCSWPEMNTKQLTSLLVRFQTATIRGANSANSRSTEAVRNTRAMALRN